MSHKALLNEIKTSPGRDALSEIEIHQSCLFILGGAPEGEI